MNLGALGRLFRPVPCPKPDCSAWTGTECRVVGRCRNPWRTCQGRHYAALPDLGFHEAVKLYRLNHGLTQREMATRLGYASVFQYQRLEHAGANPTLATIRKFHKAFPDFHWTPGHE